jgi:hydroxymethylpyrimidine pyrophosphatase-like HAD family hydrolase
MKVSFDIDGTLNTLAGRRMLEKKQADPQYKIYVVTGRCKSQRTLDYTKSLGIPDYMVYFTCGKPKYPTLQALGIELHFDNNANVAKEIRDKTNTRVELLN